MMGRGEMKLLPLALGESQTALHFHRLMIGRDVYFSKNYIRVVKRNSYSIIYTQRGELCYGQIRLQDSLPLAVVDRLIPPTQN